MFSIVGNFQETQVALVHFIGASLAFGLGTLYLWMQAVVAVLTQRESLLCSAGLLHSSDAP